MSLLFVFSQCVSCLAVLYHVNYYLQRDYSPRDKMKQCKNSKPCQRHRSKVVGKLKTFYRALYLKQQKRDNRIPIHLGSQNKATKFNDIKDRHMFGSQSETSWRVHLQCKPRGYSLQWSIREGSARKGTFLSLQVYERGRGISLVEVYEREGKSVISTCKKALQG